MKNHDLKIARNVDEYLEIIKSTKILGRIWFRGMSKANRQLTPTLFREKRQIGLEFSGGSAKNGEYYRKSQAVMKSDFGVLKKFKQEYDKLYPEKSKSFNLIDYLFVMQHYDIPTRLLDFSEDELIALYFSVSKDIISKENPSIQESEFLSNRFGNTDKGSSIHCIDPVFSNNKSYGVNKVSNFDNINDIDTLYGLDFPVCIRTDNNDKRIIAQKGVFMLYGREYPNYDSRDIFIPNITKIFIPNHYRKGIKEELKQKYNIQHTTVYPDLKGIANEIIEDIELKYKNDCEEIFGI